MKKGRSTIHDVDTYGAPSCDRSRTSPVDAAQSGFLSELVSGLTATRDEAGLRRTIDEWKARVRAAGLDPDALIDLFKSVRYSDPDVLPSDCTWARLDKREFVLVCIDVYVRNCSS